MPQGTGGPQGSVRLDRPVDLVTEVGVEGPPTVVQVHRDRLDRGVHTLDGEVDEGHVADRAQGLGPQARQRS
jgi:hypothetical protein